MSVRTDRLGPRLRRYAVASVALWAVVVAAALWFLRRAQPAHVRALPLTHADSIGLPVVAFALSVAGALLVANAAVAAVLLWRRRRRARDA
ncbi:MAG: hypothetical protein ACXWZS_12755 [Gemmatirosa sp.]